MDARGVAPSIALASRDEGPPGLRPREHAHPDGARLRDPDGDKLCVPCRDAPG
ncbi:MAG: hypothetical protein U1E95_01430 [Rubrivivax sp.]